MKKIGRNDPCFCGSGKKNKKCCLNNRQNNHTVATGLREHISVAHDRNLSSKQPALLTTTTNELFMHARLYYNVHNKSDLINHLSKLQCIDIYEKDEFIINYIHETQNIGLAVKHNKVPKELQPIILAKGKFIDGSEMVLDLRSFERACGVIEFLNAHINRDIAEITHVATHNKLHRVTKNTASDVMNVDYDKLFSNENMHYPDKAFANLMSEAEDASSRDEKMQTLMSFIAGSKAENPVLVEKFPVHYYEDGIELLKFSLKFRQKLAHEHMFGDESLNMFQLISQTIPDLIGCDD